MSTAKPRAWPPPTARAPRPQPPAKQAFQVPDAVAAHFARLLDDSAVMALIDAELGQRPGPCGLPIRAALICLLISIHYTGKATLAEAWRLADFSLSPSREHLGLSTKRPHPHDVLACEAAAQRFYRTFDRLTSLLDPARHDRRSRLPQAEADHLAAAWDDEPEHQYKRTLLQNIVTKLVLTPVRRAKGRGYLAGFRGDVGIDTTAVPVFARPPRTSRSTGEQFASTEITAGWHHSAGNGPPAYGYSATLTLTVAARTRSASAAGPFPQLALGLVLDTPHKRIGANAITTLKPLPALGLPTAFAVVDRAYTDQQAAHFAHPIHELGYKLALDYKVDQRGVQGSVHSALLIDGTLACPLIPQRLATATTGLDDAAARTPTEDLKALINAREPYFLRLKQSPTTAGAVRFQCPAAGTSPSHLPPLRPPPPTRTKPPRPGRPDRHPAPSRPPHGQTPHPATGPRPENRRPAQDLPPAHHHPAPRRPRTPGQAPPRPALPQPRLVRHLQTRTSHDRGHQRTR
ncbi:hypothetical protein AB0K48_11035 [Nonomuraea sp. NPDC055795]